MPILTANTKTSVRFGETLCTYITGITLEEAIIASWRGKRL
jgi:hypothetical protein